VFWYLLQDLDRNGRHSYHRLNMAMADHISAVFRDLKSGRENGRLGVWASCSKPSPETQMLATTQGPINRHRRMVHLISAINAVSALVCVSVSLNLRAGRVFGHRAKESLRLIMSMEPFFVGLKENHQVYVVEQRGRLQPKICRSTRAKNACF
jgi:hypothetical protein